MTAPYTTDLHHCGCAVTLTCECNPYVVKDGKGVALSTHRFMADADKLRDKLNEIAEFERAASLQMSFDEMDEAVMTGKTLNAYEQVIERERFEQACYVHYLERHATGKTEDRDNTPGMREDLLWRDAQGNYGVLMFNAAWWAWQEALR